MVFDHSEGASDACKSIISHSISGPIDHMDFYYYCALIGFRYLLLGDSDIRLKEFSKDYTKSYARVRYLMAALLIDAELKRTGQNHSKENISAMFSKYLDNNDIVLKPEGVALMNRYAQGGFEYLSKNASSMNDTFQFIRTCEKLINEKNQTTSDQPR